LGDNDPTELEQFKVWAEINGKLGKADEKYSTFMLACLAEDGSTMEGCATKYADANKPPEKTPPAGAPPASGITEEIKPLMEDLKNRLEVIENAKTEERVTVRDGVVAEIKKVDKTFDEKPFVEGDNVESQIRILSTYLSSIKHYRETAPEPTRNLSMGGDELTAAKDKAAKALWGVEKYDPDEIVKLF